MCADARAQEIDVPMYIGGEEVRSGNKKKLSPPHDHKHVLGYFHEGDKSHVEQAIQAALNARELWVNLGWEHRAAIFLKAAEAETQAACQAINTAQTAPLAEQEALCNAAL